LLQAAQGFVPAVLATRDAPGDGLDLGVVRQGAARELHLDLGLLGVVRDLQRMNGETQVQRPGIRAQARGF
jgi:hypothetical protein